jgi:hypothetical protein
VIEALCHVTVPPVYGERVSIGNNIMSAIPEAFGQEIERLRGYFVTF